MLKDVSGINDEPFESKAAIARWYGCSDRIVFTWAGKPDWPPVPTPSTVDEFLARNRSPYARTFSRAQQQAAGAGGFPDLQQTIWRCFGDLLHAIDSADALIKAAPSGDRAKLRASLDATLYGELRALDGRTHAKFDFVASRIADAELDELTE